jgi:restriction system protein
MIRHVFDPPSVTLPRVPVPDFQSIMQPMLRATGDRQVHRIRDLVDRLSSEFNLSDAERQQKLPSGAQAIFDNRVNWTATYLKKAGLLSAPARAHVQITDEGLKVLATNPERIDIKFLKRYPAFVGFHVGAEPVAKVLPSELPPAVDGGTPEETLESIWSSLRSSLGGDLLAAVKSSSPEFFERLVVDLLVAMGYGGSIPDAGATLGKSGDGGLDGVIKEDKLGLDVVYVQAKRWDAQVGRPLVQAFAGSLEGARARKGVFISTSTFSGEAHAYVRQIEKRIVLIDGDQLVKLMMDHGVGVTTARTYSVLKIDQDYFDEGA